MKIAEFDRVVTDYAISRKKAGNVKVHINVHPDIYPKRWVKGETQTPLFPGLQHKSYAQAVYDIYDFMMDNNINCPIEVERLISQIDEGVLV